MHAVTRTCHDSVLVGGGVSHDCFSVLAPPRRRYTVTVCHQSRARVYICQNRRKCQILDRARRPNSVAAPLVATPATSTATSTTAVATAAVVSVAPVVSVAATSTTAAVASTTATPPVVATPVAACIGQPYRPERLGIETAAKRTHGGQPTAALPIHTTANRWPPRRQRTCAPDPCSCAHPLVTHCQTRWCRRRTCFCRTPGKGGESL